MPVERIGVIPWAELTTDQQTDTDSETDNSVFLVIHGQIG